MKKAIVSMVTIFALSFTIRAQDADAQKILTYVSGLDKAVTVKDYQRLANDFLSFADLQKTQWLPYYYAAFCNSKIGWLYQDDGDKIEPYADKAEEQIKKALSLLDTANQKRALSEVYCVMSMLNQARVFMNPMVYGPKYGPAASQYIQLAKKADPENPRALYLEGWEKYYTPKMWGGDKKKAKELLQVAEQKLNNMESATVEPHWGKKDVEDLLNQIK